MSQSRQEIQRALKRHSAESTSAARKQARDSSTIKKQAQDALFIKNLERTQNCRISPELIDKMFRGDIFKLSSTHPLTSMRALVAISSPHKESFHNICRHMSLVARNMLESEFRANTSVPRVLLHLALQADRWIREPDTWKPESHNIHKRFGSFARHLLAKYHTPSFLDSVYMESVYEPKLMGLFPHVAQGGNLREYLSSVVPLTKKMVFLLLESPSNLTLCKAIRRAQMLSFTNEQRLVSAVSNSFLGNGFLPFNQEEFFLTVCQWFSNNPMVDRAQVGPMLDYIQFCRRQDANFSIAGRSARRLFLDMERWHRELHQNRKYADLPKEFKPSGWKSGIFHSLERGATVQWEIKEVLTSDGLFKEGKAQKHCVYSYGQSIVSGQTSIWTLTKAVEVTSKPSLLFGPPERGVTIEVNNRAARIVQVKGYANRYPHSEEDRIVRSWATHANLSYNR